MSALAISLLVSHVRAEAEALGLDLTEGLMQRLERYVALMIGLAAPGALLPVLFVLTVLGGLTAVQRAFSAWGQLGPSGEAIRLRTVARRSAEAARRRAAQGA